MKKETVTLKNVKKDIRSGMAKRNDVMIFRLSLAAVVVLGALVLCVMYRLFSPISAVRRLAVAPIVVTSVILGGIVTRFIIYFVQVGKATRRFKVAKQPVEGSASLEVARTDERRLYGENGDDPGGMPFFDHIMYFRAGKWILPKYCFRWSMAHYTDKESFFRNTAEGTECYVIYGGDREVYAAYPVEWFELSREVKDIEIIREENKERRRRY